VTRTFHLDVERCSGCFACVVACLDQNDLEAREGKGTWRHVFAVESGAFPDADLRYVSLACMHCTAAPCVAVCPSGALWRSSDRDAVLVETAVCIGCHMCSTACPFGVPRYGADGRMHKCDLCGERVAEGLEPACVRVCPTRALRYGDADDLLRETGQRAARRLADAEGTGGRP
jgi:anaerobic dimethyl sulfoxide reductase subunit B